MRLLVCFSLLFICSFLQAQENRTRTRILDYTKYDQAMAALPYAPDKIKAAKTLIDEANKLFTAEDEEYFFARKMAAIYYEQTYDYTKALELLQQAVEAYEKNFPFFNRGYSTITPETALFIYTDLSRVQRSLGLYEKTIKFLESKKSVLDQNSMPSLRLQYYSELAQALLGAEQYQESIETTLKLKELIESGALAMKMQSADEIFKINESDPLEVKEQMAKAKAQYEKSMRDAQEATLGSQRIVYNAVLATAYFKQFQYAESIPYTRAWLDQMKKMYAYSDQAFATAKAQMANYADSLKRQINESIEFTSKIQEIGGSSISMVIAACKTNQNQLAEQYTKGLVDKAMFFQLTKQFDKAEQTYQSAFALMKSLSNYRFAGSSGDQIRTGVQPSYVNLQVQKGNLESARSESLKVIEKEEALLKKSFQFFSESEKKEFFKAYNQKLERYFSLLFLMNEKDKNHSEEILNKILQTKGIILDITREQEKRLKKSNDKTLIGQVNQIRKLRDKLSGFYQLSLKTPNPAISDSINKVSFRINELERKVNEKLGTPADVLKAVSWKEIQAKLKSGEVYLEILRLNRENFAFEKPIIQYWAFAVKKGDTQPTLFQLSEGESFDGRGLKNYQNRIRGSMEDDDSYKLYWAKINENTSGASKVFMSSDGVYHMINPLTLKNTATGKYLLNEVALSRVSTGRDFLANASTAITNKEVALIGNPTFEMSRKGVSNQNQQKEVIADYSDAPLSRSGFSMLPGTQKEVESIQLMASTKGMKTNVLSGNRANESLVKNLNSPSLLHIATHGEFDQSSKAESYLKSKLILAGAADKEPFTINDYSKYEDGFLTAYEVTQLELSQTSLVVLSACETGLGEIQSGEGVWGLQRAFQLAGAKTVMGSLWKISDEATVTFMTAFYKSYFSGADIRSSYQKAMEATMTVYPHPYYWGAFTLTGVN